MNTAKQQYSELLALTKLYLTQEYKPTERIFADSECYQYFLEYAISKKTPVSSSRSSSTPIIPQATPAAPTLPPPPLQPTPSPKATSNLPSPQPATPTPITPNPAPISKELPPSAPQTAPLLSTAPEVKTLPPDSSPAAKTDENTKAPSGIFTIEAPAPAASLDLKDMWEFVKERLPGIELLATPPNDTLAKEAARQWEKKPATLEVAILSFETEPKHKAFLDNLSKALKTYGISAVVVNAARAEQEKAWPRLLEAPHVRLIISGGYGLYTLTSLMQHYVEGQRPHHPKLGKIPLLMLSDAALYLKEPSLKPSLWKSLKELLTVEA